VKKCIGLLDLQDLLPSLKIKTEVLLQKCPTIMPRYYTIASSSTMHPELLHIAVSLSAFDAKVGDASNARMGMVSGFLDTIWKDWQKGN
jgi:NADPH-ferrihemoprotein reductase